jgi:hypothetical protein
VTYCSQPRVAVEALAPQPGVHAAQGRAQAGHVVHRLERAQAPVDRRAAEQVARQKRDQRLLHAQGIARLHEQVTDGRVGHAVDEPGEIAHAVPHPALESAQLRRRRRRIPQVRIDRVACEERAVHRQHHARGEHRVDEGVRIAQHYVPVAAHALGGIRIVSGGRGFAGQLGVPQAFRQRGAQGDRVHQERTRVGLARLQVIRPAHRAHAGQAVAQRNEPEPAVLEPEDADIAFILARQALRTGEVPVDRRARVLRVLALDGEFVGEKGVAPRGIDKEPRSPGAGAAVGVADADQHELRVGEIDRSYAGFLVSPRSASGGIPEQDMVEVIAPHFVGIGLRLVPRLAEIEGNRFVVMRRNELRAVLLYADPADLFVHAQLLEQGHVQRQQRFADVKPGVALLLRYNHVPAALREQCRYRGARRAAAEHEYIAGLIGFLHLLARFVFPACAGRPLTLAEMLTAMPRFVLPA